jgi:O-antigen/teichoic acid export membrane protein
MLDRSSRREPASVLLPEIGVDRTGPILRPVPSLRANFAWTLVGNILYAGCQWGMLSVLAKLGSAPIVGGFTLGLAVSAPVFMFTNLQLRAVQATDVSGEVRFSDYFTLRLLTTLLGFAIVSGILPFLGESSDVKAVIALVSLSKCFECMSDVTAGLLQREEQLKRVSISLIIRGIASVTVFSLVFTYWRNTALSIAAMSAVWLAVLLFYDVPNVRRLIGYHAPFFRFDGRVLSRVAMLGLPLGWVATLSSLNTNIPRYFLQHYLGLADQGIFASLAYLVVVINLIVFALTQSVTTRLARLFLDGNRGRFVDVLTKLCGLGILIMVTGVPASFALGRPLLTFLYRREYSDHVGLLAILVAVSGVTTIGSFLFCGLTAARQFRVQLPVYAAGVATSITASALLVPRAGLIGAGLALLLSVTVILVGGLHVMHTTLRPQP